MFACRYCDLKFGNILQYNKHFRIHRNLKDLEISCLYPDCKVKCKTYISFQQHILRFHKIFKNNYGKCKYHGCSYSCRNVNLMKKHYSNHASIGDKNIICSYCSNIKSEFSNINAYRVHLSRCHRNENIDNTLSESNTDQTIMNMSDLNNVEMSSLIKNCAMQVLQPYQLRPQDQQSLQLNAQQPDDQECQEQYLQDSDKNKQDEQQVIRLPENVDEVLNNTLESTFNSETKMSNVKDKDEVVLADSTVSLADVFLTLSTKYFATERLIQGVTENMYSAFNLCKGGFIDSISKSNIPESNKNFVNDIFNINFNGFTNALNPTDGILRNTYTRKTYYKSTLNYVEPKEITIQNKDQKDTTDFYTYVPILRTLENMLQNDNVRKYFNYSDPTKNVNDYFDINDGSVVKENSLFTDKDFVKMALFQDGFDVCNPLGSSKCKFKLIGIYMTLLNLPPFLRSKTDNIKLVLLCREKYIVKYGWKEILKVLMKDLKYLETHGITVQYGNETKTFKGTLVVMFGDNLGSHQIGGFTGNFSNSTHFCRYCETSFAEFHRNPLKRKTLRTVENYRECTREAAKKRKIIKGVKENSALNGLQYYHVSKPGLPPCIAHDLFEGIVAYDMQLMMDYFLEQSWFKVGLLNWRLNDVNLLGENKLFIPYVKLKSKRLTGTASQIKRLLLIFPIAISDLIKDFDEPIWKMVLALRNMCSLICAPALSVNQIALLHAVIKKYMQYRIQCFPEVPLRPKHEFVLHYPTLIKYFGPLKHSSTLRFEAKHKYFKNLAKHLQNFKNITQTFAEKHELLQCSLRDQFSCKAEPGGTVLVYTNENYDSQISNLINDLRKKNINIEFTCETLKFRGICYSQGMYICVGKNTNGNFVICKIRLILLNMDYSEIYFLGSVNEIVFCPEIGVFEIAQYQQNESRTQNFSIFPFSSLLLPNLVLECHINSFPVYLMKNAPYDPDI